MPGSIEQFSLQLATERRCCWQITNRSW